MEISGNISRDPVPMLCLDLLIETLNVSLNSQGAASQDPPTPREFEESPGTP